MFTYSQVIVLANTTHTIKVGTYGNDGTFASFTVATHDLYAKDDSIKRTTIYSDWVAFGKLAERLGSVPVGSLVLLEGRLDNDKFIDKFNQKRLKIKMIVKSMRVIRTPDTPQESEPQQVEVHQ